MPNNYVGPSGQPISAANGEPSDHDHERRASFPTPVPLPLQLPPPRSSGTLQSSDPFLAPRRPVERLDSGIGLPATESAAMPPRSDQLPSVSQLLAPSVQPAATSFPPQPFGTPAVDGRMSPLSSRHSNLGFHYWISQPSPYDVATGQPERMSPQHQKAEPLPIISHVAAPISDEEPHLYGTSHADSPAQTRRTPSIPYLSTAFYDSGARNDNPSMGSSAPGATAPRSPIRPHVVDERYVEGEGLCYIYADGSHIPKAIDGVPVNANWGVTKAGKPRKRLAQACLTCREKKIKCQPNLPKCDQCQKSGRECRFESAPRGNRAAMRVPQPSSQSTREGASSTPYETAGLSSSPYGVGLASESPTSLPGAPGHSPISETSMLATTTVDGIRESVADTDSLKRTRSKSSTSGDDFLRRFNDSVAIYTSPDYSDILTETKDIDPADPLARHWTTDPYDVDPDLTIHFIECYFDYVNDTLYHIFPRGRFLLWLRSCRTKSLDDKMLLYAMLSMGSIFSDRPDRLIAMKTSSKTVRYAVEHSQHTLTLQLAQTRIILSLWYYAIGDLVKSWDSIGAAVRTVCGLRYNIEPGGVVVDQSRTCQYGLHPQALIECRRRAFWAAFLIDRLSSNFSPSTVSFLPSQTALLRLPCREDIYEAQQYATVPYFQTFYNQAQTPAEQEVSTLSASAFLIEIVSLWGDVSQHVFRSPHIPAEIYSKVSEEVHATVMQRSDTWMKNLPPHLEFTAENLQQSISAGRADAFISIHLLYHATLLKLNRYVRHQHFRAGTVSQCVHRARHHATQILRHNLALARFSAERNASRLAISTPLSLRSTLLNPFLGYVILSAVDVLSAAGPTAEMKQYISLIEAGIGTVKELGAIWGSSVTLAYLMEMRAKAMIECFREPALLDAKIAFAVDGPSLDSRIRVGIPKHDTPGALPEDIMYGGLARGKLLAVLGIDESSIARDRVIWIHDRE